MRPPKAPSSLLRSRLQQLNAKHRDAVELERALFSGGARRVIANSQMVKREAEEYYGYPADRIDLVPNGIPLVDFHPDLEARSRRRKIMQLRDDEIAVLFVGSGWERKGLRYATEAVGSLGEKFRLFVAGRGRGRKVGGRAVQYLGAVRDLPSLYAAADIFL